MAKSTATQRAAAAAAKGNESSSASNQAPYQPFVRADIVYKQQGIKDVVVTKPWPYAITISSSLKKKGADGKPSIQERTIAHPKLVPAESVKRKFYWNFFHILEENGKKTDIAVCNLCGRCMSIGNRGYISLGRHLESTQLLIDPNILLGGKNNAQQSHHAIYSKLAKQEGKEADLLDIKSKEKNREANKTPNNKRKRGGATDPEAKLQARLTAQDDSLRKAKEVLKELKGEDGYDSDASEAQLQKGIVAHFKEQKKLAFAELQQLIQKRAAAEKEEAEAEEGKGSTPAKKESSKTAKV